MPKKWSGFFTLVESCCCLLCRFETVLSTDLLVASARVQAVAIKALGELGFRCPLPFALIGGPWPVLLGFLDDLTRVSGLWQLDGFHQYQMGVAWFLPDFYVCFSHWAVCVPQLLNRKHSCEDSNLFFSFGGFQKFFCCHAVFFSWLRHHWKKIWWFYANSYVEMFLCSILRLNFVCSLYVWEEFRKLNFLHLFYNFFLSCWHSFLEARVLKSPTII